MRLFFPPLAQFIVFGLAGYGLSEYLPSLDYASNVGAWSAFPLSAVGVLILIQAVRSFGAAKTTVNPIEPEKAERLVSSGLYRFTRNPMYLGMLLVLVGGALFLHNFAALVGPLAYLVSMTIFQIRPEERVLRDKFGEAYKDYCQQTRRWI